MNAETRSEMFGRLLKQIPNPTTELNYSTSFELLVAVTLSAQATDKSVNQVTDILFPLANTPESIFELGEDKLRDTIKSIGLFNSKAKHIIQTCRIIIDKYNSEVPETRKELEALPGVGRKTANVVLNTAFGQPTIAVDTHIYRVANRTAIASGKTVLEVEKKLIKTNFRGRVMARVGSDIQFRREAFREFDFIRHECGRRCSGEACQVCGKVKD